MTTVMVILIVSIGSLLFRLAPLLGASRVPDSFSRTATWAGLSVLTAITIRGVLHHQDDGTPAATLVAAISVGLGLLLTASGRSILVVLAVGTGSYLALSTLLIAFGQ